MDTQPSYWHRGEDVIEITWGNSEEMYIVMTIHGQWTAHEVRKAGQRIQRLMQEKPHTVHAVVDLLNAGRPPETIVPIAYYPIARHPKHSGCLTRLCTSELCLIYSRKVA